jgi:hypothetical protein
VWLQPTSHPKLDKDRDHPDLRTDGDGDAEIERLVALGARRVGIGQADTDPFVVLADPEGNEFSAVHAPARGVPPPGPSGGSSRCGCHGGGDRRVSPACWV